jgi:hypothetical protein
MNTRLELTLSGIVCTTLLAAGSTAFGQCDTTAPAGAIDQNDPLYCGSEEAVDPNGGCNQDTEDWQDVGVLSASGLDLAGNVGAFTNGTGETRDLDWYRFTAPANGSVTVTFNSFNNTAGADPADFAGFWGENTAECATATLQGFLFECGGTFTTNVMAGGSYGVIATINAFGDAGGSDCTTHYLINVAFEEAAFHCGDPSQGDCLEANGTPGCDDLTCCLSVCETDSACCDGAWDDVCASNAADLCAYLVCEPGTAVLGDNAIDTTASTATLDLTGICDPGAFGDDVIYNAIYLNFTPDTTSAYTISTCSQATFDTRLAVNTDGCDPTTNIGCLDDTDGCDGFTTILEVSLTAGEEYTICVGGYSSADAGTGTLTIEAGGAPDPCEGYDNDCTNPQVVGLGDYTVTSAPCGDVDYTGFCDPGEFGDDILNAVYFFEFTPDADGDYTVSTCNTAVFDTRLGIQTDACDPSSVIACLDDTEGCANFTTTLSATLTGGVAYTIVLGGYAAGNAGEATVSITDGSGGGGGGCDDYTNTCANPEVVAGYGDYDFNTTCALAAGDRSFDLTGFCDPGEFGDDIVHNAFYFEFVATADGDYEFSTCNNAAFDTRLFVSSSCDPSSTIACNDDGTDDAGEACTGFTSRIQVTLTAGTYIVGAGGYAAANAGLGTLTISGPDGPPPCSGDLNGDGQVDGADLTILLGAWGTAGADLNGDGTVDGADLTILLGGWGACP